MISWPNWRRRIPPRASSGSSFIRPKMFRVAGSASMPRSRSGPLRWKKLSACDWTICARFISRRSFSAAGGIFKRQDRVPGLGRGHQVADRADPADSSGDPGHLPERSSLAELLEAAELRDVESGVGHLPRLVEVDGDLRVPLDPRHRVDDDHSAHRLTSSTRSDKPVLPDAAITRTGSPLGFKPWRISPASTCSSTARIRGGGRGTAGQVDVHGDDGMDRSHAIEQRQARCLPPRESARSRSPFSRYDAPEHGFGAAQRRCAAR